MFLKEGPTLCVRAANEMIPFNNIYFLGALFPPPDSVAKLGRKGTKWLSLHSEPVQDKIRTPYIHFFFKHKQMPPYFSLPGNLPLSQPHHCLHIFLPISEGVIVQRRPQIYTQVI